MPVGKSKLRCPSCSRSLPEESLEESAGRPKRAQLGAAALALALCVIGMFGAMLGVSYLDLPAGPLFTFMMLLGIGAPIGAAYALYRRLSRR